MTTEGKPYGPFRYKQIVKERYFIAKHANISYSDTGNITPTERKYLLDFIAYEIKRQNELVEQYKQQRNK